MSGGASEGALGGVEGGGAWRRGGGWKSRREGGGRRGEKGRCGEAAASKKGGWLQWRKREKTRSGGLSIATTGIDITASDAGLSGSELRLADLDH